MAKQKLLLPGILVKRPRAVGKDSSHPFFDLVFAHNSSANPMFFTSPALREALAKSKYREGEQIGNFHYILTNFKLSRGRGLGAFTYPFDSARNKKVLLKKGIARGLERIVLRELRNYAGENLPLTPALGAEPVRAKQLKKLGVKVYEEAPGVFDYKISLDDLRRRINEARNKYRKEHRLPPKQNLAHAKKAGLKLRQRRV